MTEFAGKKIVFRVEDDMDPKDVYCTTYQMRNFYQQMADGFFSSLDVMNYIQHHKVVTMMKKGDHVLDVCCGRGLVLPMMRWYKKEISSYTGVDISEKNISEQLRKSGIKNITDQGLDYYPFAVHHLIASVEDMDKELPKNHYDLIIYTSAIEHMQKEAGYKSLQACYKLLKPGKPIFISCPNTMNKKDPYDTQYRAHLYEWDLEELSTAMKEIGFEISNVFGLVAKKKQFDQYMEEHKRDNIQSRYLHHLYKRLSEYFPTDWLMAFFPVLYPQAAAEVAIVATKPYSRLQMG